MTRRNVILRTTVAALLAFGISCSKREQPRQYPLRGYVVELDPKANAASIHAEKIDGFMGEMTMDYQVENRSEYQSLRKGEKITATVNVTDEKYWLTNVRENK
jgi:Cu/Ag efflux protein CusF